MDVDAQQTPMYVEAAFYTKVGLHFISSLILCYAVLGTYQRFLGFLLHQYSTFENYLHNSVRQFTRSRMIT